MKGVQHVSMTDLVITKHITMEKWKKNKRHLSEKRTTKFDFWKRKETHTHTKRHNRKSHRVHIIISIKTVVLPAAPRGLMLDPQY